MYADATKAVQDRINSFFSIVPEVYYNQDYDDIMAREALGLHDVAMSYNSTALPENYENARVASISESIIIYAHFKKDEALRNNWNLLVFLNNNNEFEQKGWNETRRITNVSSVPIKDDTSFIAFEILLTII